MGQESQSIESIFDFFYLDNPKIKSFYAQLNGLGALNTLKNTSQIGDTRKLEASVGVPTITGGKMGNDHSVSTTSEHLYDGLPTMPREMIDRLDELGFIRKELNADMLGNLVLLKGRLGVFDIGVSKELMDPALNMHIKDLERDPRNKKEAAELKKNKQDLVNFCKSIPFSLEAKVLVKTGSKTDEGVDLAEEVWMTLNRAEMSGSSHDLNFKHGEFLAGDWHVLGVLDALPFDDFTFDTDKNDFREGISSLIQLMKEFVGRPKTAYGLTPIAIFRVLKAKAK
ncbi:hypothetical protein ACKEPO_15950 [Acinetobacter baumannii]|uniref:hypothetical protein n=1 Tax=Acinetobacter baumannii TaxID=470 RepID=UPI002957B745|nr:hypothetical protein [Acinetobacter baumannii]MDX7938815.1 hypothetical protein [Acinetobacter baumannii]MDX7942293.1 hypothetical protein [Acinetobacter baumannii]